LAVLSRCRYPSRAGGTFFNLGRRKPLGLLERKRRAKMSCPNQSPISKGRRNDVESRRIFFTSIGRNGVRECGKNAFNLTRTCVQSLQLYIPMDFVHCIDLIYPPSLFDLKTENKELPCCYARD
jgi:hypothetical protein